MGHSRKTPAEHSQDGKRLCDLPDARMALVEQGDKIVEAIGEVFVEERFQPTCPLPGFESARLERFTRTDFPRILLDFDCIDREQLTAERLKADLARLTGLVCADPEKFQRLADHLDDPDAFRDLASDLGLTEEGFLEEDGGFIGWVIVIAAALVLTGCPSTSSARCGVTHRLDNLPCSLPQGHPGKHRDRAGHRW